MKIDLAIGSDHRGYEMKEFLTKFLTPIDRDIKYDITTFMDIGTYNDAKKVDYPDIVNTLAKDMETWDKKKAGWETFNRGILICGSGYGVCMAANRHSFIRAVTVRTQQEAEMARKHNDANVLCLGADFTPNRTAKKIVEAFLTTEFEGGRHKKRIKKFS
tara:strand:- start:15 stop:494 length:480 start_codon:yes stop_codon:yes gene_type:complete